MRREVDEIARIHHAVDVEHAVEDEDEVLTLLWSLGTSGIIELGPGRRTAFFRSMPSAVIAALGLLPGVSAAARRVVDEDWIRQSRRHLRAQRIGPLLIRAPWSRAGLKPGESLLVIDPARAFGTGGHESTRLALAALTVAPPRGQRVLDVGCGSGILALAALRLGAAQAIALDFDVEATAATVANARRNRLVPWVVLGEIHALAGSFDLVLANLTFPLLMAQAGALTERVSRTGSLICAGLLTCDRDALVARLQNEGFRTFLDSSEGEWHAVVARR